MQTKAASSLTEEELREFFLIVRRALLMIVRWIEKHYLIDPRGD
jgi:hypothetical protein